MAIRRDQEKFPVRAPCGARRSKFVAPIGEIAVGHLARGAAFRGHDEHLHVAGLEITGSVKAIDEAIVRGWRVSPFRAGGRRGQVGKVRTFPDDQGRKGDHPAVGRPGDGVRRLLQIGDAGGLAGVHPANVDLLLAVHVREECDARSVGRPARRAVGMVAAGKWPMVGAVGVDNPQIGVALIGHGIGEATNVDDFLAVGRNLRIGGELKLELVHGREVVGRILRSDQNGKRKKRCCGHTESGAQEQFHGTRPPRRRGVNNGRGLVSRW